jgi:hypothetical protein
MKANDLIAQMLTRGVHVTALGAREETFTSETILLSTAHVHSIISRVIYIRISRTVEREGEGWFALKIFFFCF